MSRFLHSAAPDDAATDAASPRGRLRFELIFASAWLAFGLFVLPALIFAVGMLLLGPYGEGAGLGQFYLDFFADLAQPAGRTWLIALGPLLLITIVRLLFLGISSQDPNHAAPQQGPSRPSRARRTTDAGRVEPRIGVD